MRDNGQELAAALRALANATETRLARILKRIKAPILHARSAIGYNPVLARNLSTRHSIVELFTIFSMF